MGEVPFDIEKDLGTSVVGLGLFWAGTWIVRQIPRIRKELSLLERPETPGSLIKKLGSKDNSLPQFKRTKEELVGKILLKGKVIELKGSLQKRVAQDGASPKVVHSIYKRGTLFSNDFQRSRYQETELLERSEQIVPFKLKEEGSETCVIEVCPRTKIEARSFSHFHQQKKDMDISGKHQFLHDVFRGLDLLTLGIFSLKGLKVGFWERELGLEVGTPILAYGEVIYNFSNKTLRMEHPLRILESNAWMIDDLKTKILLSLVAGGLLIGFGLALTKKTFPRICRFLKKWWEENWGPLKQLVGDDEETNESKIQCAICRKNVRKVLFKPCYHVVLCLRCANGYTNRNCPFCHSKIASRHGLYIV